MRKLETNEVKLRAATDTGNVIWSTTSELLGAGLPRVWLGTIKIDHVSSKKPPTLA